MKDTKRKAHELAAIFESVAGILFDTPETETETKRETAQWQPLVIEQGAPPLRWYCSKCHARTNANMGNGDVKDIDPFLNGWCFCPYCGASTEDDER
jgi:hypothetical protein